VNRASRRSVALAVAWRSIRNFTHNPNLFIPALLFPLFFFTAFAGGLSSISKAPNFDFPTGYTAFQFVFVLLQSAAFGGVFTGFGIARDFEMGFGRRLMVAAPYRVGILFGYAIAALVRAFITWAILITVALIAGMQIDGGGVDLFGLFGLAVIVNLAATFWAAGVALRVRSIQGAPLMQLPVFLHVKLGLALAQKLERRPEPAFGPQRSFRDGALNPVVPGSEPNDFGSLAVPQSREHDGGGRDRRHCYGVGSSVVSIPAGGTRARRAWLAHCPTGTARISVKLERSTCSRP